MSSRAQATIRDARKKERGLAVSCITLLEIARLAAPAARGVTAHTDKTLAVGAEHSFIVLPIKRNIALQAFELPKEFPNDPVDRVLGATALVEDIPLVTADRQIRKSRAVPTVW